MTNYDSDGKTYGSRCAVNTFSRRDVFTGSALVLAIAAAAGGVNHANAAGFQLSEHSARGLGRANAGEAAIGDTAAVLARNSAAMTRLDGTNITGALTFIDLEVEADGVVTLPNGAQLPDRARDDNAGPNAFVPAFYITHQINDNIYVGFAAFSNFGLKTDYHDSYAGLDHADQASVETINFSPSIAFKLNNQLSLAVGLDYVTGKAKLTTRVPRYVTGDGTTPKILGLDGDGDAFGYHLSALYEFTPQTRIGAEYRSAIDIDVEGEAKSEFPLTGLPPKVNGELELNLPEIAEVGVYHELNDTWAIHGSINYANWERFDDLVADIDGVGKVPLKEENWEMNLRYSVGVTHQLNDRFLLRGGLAYDKSPVPQEFKTLSIPDSDRIWVSAGASYLISEQYSVDFGIARLQGKEGDLTEISSLGTKIDSDVQGNATLIALQVNGAF